MTSISTRPSPRTQGQRLAHILLVEDSPADIELTRQALAEAEIKTDLTVCPDGEAAAQYLRREGEHAGAPRPDLILLDLNLPKKDGRELLVEIKQDAELSLIPIVVLTTSASDEDVLHAYREHVNCYIRKPVRLQEFIDVVRTIDQYWLSIVTLPPVEA
jgi:two-component system, chemotaxis family, response regulator Rcp1